MSILLFKGMNYFLTMSWKVRKVNSNACSYFVLVIVGDGRV